MSDDSRGRPSSTFARADLRAAAGRPRRRSALWWSLGIAVVALAAMLALQFFWLADLERASSIAMRATQRKLAEGVAKEVAYHYKNLAERALAIPAGYFAPGQEGRLRAALEKGRSNGIRRLFAVGLRGETKLIVYPEPTVDPIAPGEASEVVAIWAACSPWNLVARKTAGVVERPTLRVDERDPAHRIVIKPITDDAWRLVGLAGMVIDEEHFRAHVLPMAVASALPNLDGGGKLAVWVCDERGKNVLGDAPGCGPKDATRVPMTFAFTGWTVSLQDRRASPEAWAKKSFALNITMSLALALVLLGAIAVSTRAAGREMRLAAMKSDFVSNVSHELRTPLASIRVFGELMRLGRVGDPDKVREYGEHIEVESRRLTQLVDNILDFSRIESGRKVYHFGDTDLERVVREVVDAFVARTRASGFSVTLEAAAAPLPSVHADAAAIDHALSNLLDNAVKYSGDGREIAVRLSRDGDAAVIAVSDRGIGIPAEELAHIFERFHRVSTGAIHEVRGVGLGLAIVDHIVRAHGGTVAVASAVGKGSTFTMRLPLTAPPPAGEAATAAGGATAPAGAT